MALQNAFENLAVESKQDTKISIQTNGTQVSKIKQTVPTDTLNNNASYSVAYNGDNTINYITKTIGTTNYRKTFTYSSGSLVGISSWVVV